MRVKDLSTSLQDYLEVIHAVISERQVARARDIKTRMKVRGASVTSALRILAEKKLIHYSPYDVITLTSEGERIARVVENRHRILRTFCEKILNLQAPESDEVACRIEHGVTPFVCERIEGLVDFFTTHPDIAARSVLHIAEHTSAVRAAGLYPFGIGDNDGPPVPLTLNTLTPGTSAIIVKVSGGGAIRRRLTEMGVTPGQPVVVERAAPLDDPTEVRVRNYRLSVRREEASLVEVSLSPEHGREQ